MSENPAPYTVHGEADGTFHQVTVLAQAHCSTNPESLAAAIEMAAGQIRAGHTEATEHDDDVGYTLKKRHADTSVFGDTPADRRLESLLGGVSPQEGNHQQYRGGVVRAAALVARESPALAKEILGIEGITSGDDLDGCRAEDIASLSDRQVAIPGLADAWKRAERAENA